MEVLEKNKNVGLYYCLKIITTSLIFTVGLSWGAKAEIISVLPKEELIRRDSATEIPKARKTAKTGVVSKSLTPQKYDALNSSTILPLLVKEPKSAPLTLLPNPQKKPKVLPKQLKFIATTSQQVVGDSSSNGN